MSDNVTPDNGDFYGVYDDAKAYYDQHKGEYEASGTEWTSFDSQNMCVAPRLTPKGTIAVTKTSGIQQITDGNGCYTLGGAVYTVYSDEGLTNEVGTITTGADGKGKLERVTSGAYWVKETQRSEGYSLDPQSYEVEVEAGKTVHVNGDKGSVEIPQSDPVGMLLGKVDATTNANRPEGSATLADAQFTVRYYDDYYGSADEAATSGEPTDTWVFKTDSDGFAYYADEYKVSGPALYRQTNGDASIPLGTVAVEETKAPTGYNLDDGDKNVVADGTAQVTDTVTYENLVPGKEYILTGTLMDKATGEPLKDAKGNAVTSTAAFTPEKADGTVDVAFEFDATGLEGKTLVAFETLTRDGIEVAVHADVDDADQTVELYTPEEGTPGKGYPKTGGPVPVPPIAASIVVLSGCAAAGAAYALGKRRKGLAADSGEEPGAEPGE